MSLGLQVTLQRGDGQAAGAGAHQVDLARAGDRPADVHGFFHRFDVGRQAPFAVAHIRVAPADHEGLQAILERELNEAVVRAQVENVVLVDLWRHHQQRFGILPLAHRLVLDQLQQFVAKHHRTGGGGDGLADLECLFGDLPGQAIVVQQVVHQMADPAHQAVAAGVEDFLDRQRIEQTVGRRHGIVEQGERKVRAGAIVRAHVAVVDPAFDLLLPAQVGLQATTIKRVEGPRRVGETTVLRIGRVQGVTQQHATQLAAQFQGVFSGVHGVAQAMGGNAAQSRNQIPAAQAGNRTLCVDERGGSG
ncbi:hypothetical protein D3C71_1372450 [compost metagenome]